MVMYEVLSNAMNPFVAHADLDLFTIGDKIAREHLRPDTLHMAEPYKSMLHACWQHDATKRPTFEQLVEQLQY